MKKLLIAVLIIFSLVLLSFCGEDDAATQDEDTIQETVMTEYQELTETITEVAMHAATEDFTELSTEEPTEPLTEPPTEPPTEAPTEAAEETTKKEVLVWIPSSGSKYHSRSGCSNMKNPSQVTLEKAQSLGYEPCKR